MSCVKTRRLFLALWPEPQTVTALTAQLERVPLPPSARPLNPADLHLTLEFLGVVPEVARPSIEAVCRKVPRLNATVVLDTMESWPESQALVLSASTVPASLADAQAILRADLNALGLRVDDRPWRPHVTLARAVAVDLSRVIEAPIPWPVRRLVIAESLPTVGSTRYRPLWAHELI